MKQKENAPAGGMVLSPSPHPENAFSGVVIVLEHFLLLDVLENLTHLLLIKILFQLRKKIPAGYFFLLPPISCSMVIC